MKINALIVLASAASVLAAPVADAKPAEAVAARDDYGSYGAYGTYDNYPPPPPPPFQLQHLHHVRHLPPGCRLGEGSLRLRNSGRNTVTWANIWMANSVRGVTEPCGKATMCFWSCAFNIRQ
ncbi:hypothetical protein PG984_004130 [Apiospora sp. TS-2023a]